MLILTRRIGETLTIDDEAAGNHMEVRVLGINGNQVRIGVDAPRHVEVHREEVYNRIQKERERKVSAN